MTKVFDERERMEDLAIVFVERVARIHALLCKTIGDLHIFTATILGTRQLRILVRVMESSESLPTEDVSRSSGMVAFRKNDLDGNSSDTLVDFVRPTELQILSLSTVVTLKLYP